MTFRQKNSGMERGSVPLYYLFVHFFFIGSTQNIVYADLVKVGQGAQYMRRNHPLPAFIVGVCSLGYIDCLTYLGLCQVMIFP